jgi:FAD/FMN-containing dehydrogenase
MVSVGPHGDDPNPPTTISVGVCWPGQASVEPDALRRLRTALPVLDDTLVAMTYPEVQAMAGTLPFGLRHYWKGHFLRAMDESVIGGLVESMQTRPDSHSLILLETIRGAAHVEPEDGAAFGQRAATWNASALAIWDDPSRDDEHVAWARATADRMAFGSLTGAGYANYAPVDESIERVRLAFGTERFSRLAAIKARYDPGNRFRFNQNIAPG